MSVVNERVVWASGTGGTVLRTVDGGATWSARNVPAAACHMIVEDFAQHGVDPC